MSESILDGTYESFKVAKWYVLMHKGPFGFRFGPYEGRDVGPIMERCLKESIPLLITADCGTEFDWVLAADLRGTPIEGDLPMPTDEGKPV